MKIIGIQSLNREPKVNAWTLGQALTFMLMHTNREKNALDLLMLQVLLYNNSRAIRSKDDFTYSYIYIYYYIYSFELHSHADRKINSSQ